jgi:tRNA (guanosine-2'-O-)-methyltransferase
MKPYDRNKRISKNADKWLDIHRWKSTRACFEALRQKGFRIFSTHVDAGAKPLAALSFAGPVAIVLGNEHDGVSEEAIALADASFFIPMRGFVESFNVSVAAAIALARAVECRIAERGRHGDLSAPEAAALRERFYGLAVKQRTRIADAVATQESASREDDVEGID